MATFLVASFHTHPQLLHFNPSSSPPSLTLETLLTPSFQDYTWISRHPSINNLFYALQRFSDKPGILSIIRLAKNKDGRYQLEILKSYPSHGMDPCHLGISSQADKLAIANVNTSSPFLRLSNKAEHNTQYDSSTVTIYTLNKEDGMVNEDIEPEIYDLSRDENFKPGPNSERQEAPHPHGCFYVPKMQSFLVPDLGADRLRLIGKGKKESLPCNAGAGPRHAVINDKANVAYIVNELENTISIHDLSTTSSPPTTTYSVLPSDVSSSTKSQMCASSINITSDNRHIYVTNRLESNPKGDAIVWFDISQDGKELTRKGEIRTGLDHPRAAEIFRCENNDNHDDKEYYIVGSKTEKGAVVYGIDGNTGELKEVARSMEVLSPSGFAFV